MITSIEPHPPIKSLFSNVIGSKLSKCCRPSESALMTTIFRFRHKLNIGPETPLSESELGFSEPGKIGTIKNNLHEEKFLVHHIDHHELHLKIVNNLTRYSQRPPGSYDHLQARQKCVKEGIVSSGGNSGKFPLRINLSSPTSMGTTCLSY